MFQINKRMVELTKDMLENNDYNHFQVTKKSLLGKVIEATVFKEKDKIKLFIIHKREYVTYRNGKAVISDGWVID